MVQSPRKLLVLSIKQNVLAETVDSLVLLIFSVRLYGKKRLLLMESFKSVVMIQQGTNFVMITQMRVGQISLPYLMYHLLFYLWYKYIQFVVH